MHHTGDPVNRTSQPLVALIVCAAFSFAVLPIAVRPSLAEGLDTAAAEETVAPSETVGPIAAAETDGPALTASSDITLQGSQTHGGVTVNATAITLYVPSTGTLPAGYPTSFQIVVSGNTQDPCYTINQYGSYSEAISWPPVAISDSGLVTLTDMALTYYNRFGTACYITVTVDDQIFDIPFTLKVYDPMTAQADAIAYPWYDANVPSTLSPYEKLDKIIGRSSSYTYGTASSTYEGLVLKGSGDCWAGARFVEHLCRYAGIECYRRNGNRDPGGGSGHENDVAVIDGHYYIADGTPGYHRLTSGTYDYADTAIYSVEKSDGTLKIEQYDGAGDTLTIPATLGGSTVTEIDAYAFCPTISYRAADIRTVDIPATVTTIDEGAFSQMDSLEAINVDEANPDFKSVDGVLYTKDGKELVAYPCRRKAGTEEGLSYTVASGTATIRAHAFEGYPTEHDASTLGTVILPETVTDIGDKAFKNADISYVALPDSLRAIGKEAFNTSGVIALDIPAGVTSLGADFFNGKIIIEGVGTTPTALSYGTIYAHDGSAAQAFATANSKMFVSLDSAYTPLRSATTSETEVTVERGSHVDLSLTEDPGKATIHAVVASSDSEIAACYYNDSTGNLHIRGASYGTAYLTVYTADGQSASIKVTVPDPYDLAYATVSAIDDQAYTGGAICPSPTVTSSLGTLKVGRDCTLSYTDNVEKGIATVTITGVGCFSGTRTARFRIVRAPVRLAGNSRYATMARIVDTGFADGSCASTPTGSVILARGDDFPDALAASSLAGTLHCPVITTPHASLSADAAEEITRLGAGKVYLLGGLNSLSAQVETSVQSLGCATERIEGTSRVDTSVRIAQCARVAGATSDTCIITKGWAYADALAMSPYAYTSTSPIFLANPDGTLDAEVAQAVHDGGYTKAIVLGGIDGISDETMEGLVDRTGVTAWTRLAGASRYDTAEGIALWSTGADTSAKVQPITSAELSCSDPAIARGDDFPDALASIGLLGPKRSVLLLVAHDAADEATHARIERVIGGNAGSLGTVYLLGGTNSVDTTVEAWAKEAMG